MSIGVFVPLQDEKEFAEVRLHAELGAIGWPNGPGIDPDVLSSSLGGKPIEVATSASRKA